MTTAVKLVSTATVTGELEIVPAQGYSAQDVADALNSGRAYVSGKDVLLPHAPPAEGMMHIAQVVARKSDAQGTVWTVGQ